MVDISVWILFTQATLRGVGSKVFWAYPTTVVQEKPDLIVLYLPAGVVSKDTEIKPTPQDFFTPDKINVVDYQWDTTDVIMLIVPGEAFSIYAMWETGTKNLSCWYINLQEPIRRTRIGFDMMDHMLDIVVSPDMSEWKWKDEDEITEAERIGFYSYEKAHEIWLQGEKPVNLLTSERRSFYMQWEMWQSPPGLKIPQLSPIWNKMDL